MSKASDARETRGAQGDARQGARTGEQAEQNDWETAEPLKPRPRLFWGLMIVLVLWVGALVAMYVTTVLPRKHQRVTQPTTRVSEGILRGQRVLV
ncbi:MAG TPA: hypothetical protein VF669_20730 [Tepidisphaeraceae bacterium]|jgi:hypothetical protein